MSPNKSWMQLSRSTMAYYNGVPWLDYTYRHIQEVVMKILCPCVKCSNRYRRVRRIRCDYTTWYCHGENGDSDNDTYGDVDDGNENCENIQLNEMYNLFQEGFSQDPNEEAQKFFNLVKEVEQLITL
ncbi:hypothetical protein CICLE_v10003577mg [Citrus x clementina]|uniref:Transposase-associated domain-containing protein n=2 Tax=Citrus TaxID=2706 RepID=V4SDM4_CITCL|nr:hypothetical protein CICLE_v10003577mg [Citrus x clementina]GAY56100.1 hypothetical protein CUMW_169230 [Citrus unshiu]